MAGRTLYARPRRGYGGSDAGREAARRHIEEARQFSQEIGGSDADVKAYFFSLSDTELDAALTAYGRQYGASKEAYARETLPRWRQGSTEMSGLVAKRLFDFLPPRMPLKKKYELAGNVWRHFGPRSRHSYVVGSEAAVTSAADMVAGRLEEEVTQYSVPEHVRNRFRWLTAGDVRMQEQLLNHFRQLEKELAVRKVNEELPVLQRQVGNHGDITHRATSVIQVHRHEIELWVDARLGGGIREGRPTPPRPAPSRSTRATGFGWIWWMIGIIALVSFLIAL